MLDNLLYSEPVIEKCSTNELKCSLVSYSFFGGILFDKRANKKTRRFWFAYNLVNSSVVLVCAVFYLFKLKAYDFRVVALAAEQIAFILLKIACLWSIYYRFDKIKQTMDFLTNEDDNSSAEVPQESADGYIEMNEYGASNMQTASKSTSNDCIDKKKWMIVLASLFLGTYLLIDLMFDPEDDIQILVRISSSMPHFYKFFVMWYPFEDKWLKMMLSIFQDILVIPELCFYFFSILMVIVIVTEIHNKLAMVCGKLKISSRNTFERIESLDNQIERVIDMPNEELRLNIIEMLDEEKTKIIDAFYDDLFLVIKRYQQLIRYDFNATCDKKK